MYTTYLCNGLFCDDIVNINKKVKISLFESIIDEEEWLRKYVIKNELVTYLASKCDKEADCRICQILPDSIVLVYSDMYDLFMEEDCDVFVDGSYKETNVKYILVERNCAFKVN